MTATAVAVDAGTRFTRIAVLGAYGAPELARLSGSVPGEGVPVPQDAAAGRDAALRAAYGEYCGSHGIPDRVVLVVREQDRAGAADRAADALASVHGTRPAPRIRVLGTPHAVLALLRHEGAPPSARYTVCDLGASAAEVSVCVPVSGTVAVTGRAWHAPADGYGGGLDRALLAAVGLPDDGAGLRALAGARGETGAAERLGIALRRADSHRGRYDDTAVHRVDGREITAGVVRRALGRLTEGLDRVLDEALGGAQAPPVIAVGGAARFGPLVGHLAARHGPLVALPGATDPALAAVFGAALVAAGRADPGDRYPHAVLVGTHRVVGGAPRSEELVISPAGVLEPGGATVFAETGGHRVPVATGTASPAGPAPPVRVRVRDARGERAEAVGTLTLPAGGEGDRFHVGVRIAVDGTAHLVLHPLGSAAPGEIPLGTLPTDLEGAGP
ncbi:hypothetical protein ACFXPI_03190 [Streptomyces sp. NPDC059104]|uniref:hypothetical protein n=1 Tax=Streptomyces sp. NPDC059104 TaxID=3346729 RepID=UPI0036AD5A10